MLMQKCQIDSPYGRLYIKGFKLDGSMDTTDKWDEAMIWPNHYWSMCIEETDLSQFKPQLFDVTG